MMHATWRGAAAAVCDSEGSDGTRFHVSQPAPTGRGVEECRRGTVVREHESRVDSTVDDLVEPVDVGHLAVDRCLARR
jgi:hypothetical protein